MAHKRQADWWVKVKRAQRHMVEIRRCVRAYSERHPYEAVRIRYSKSEGDKWGFSLRITEDPEPELSAMVGDFVHNLRSALDVAVVGHSRPSARRRSASFPIATEDLWERDAFRRYVIRDSERRKSFNRAIAGLNPTAKAVIKQIQPYHGDIPRHDIMGILARLDTADKHKRLLTVGSGLISPVTTMTARGETAEYAVPIGRNQFLKDGAPLFVATWNVNPPLHESEVQVKTRGTVEVHVKVARSDNQPAEEFHLLRTMSQGIRNVRAFLMMIEQVG
ncbi:MAG: hypothetical protein R3B59_04355 [Dehalococcoidia bacterium]